MIQTYHFHTGFFHLWVFGARRATNLEGAEAHLGLACPVGLEQLRLEGGSPVGQRRQGSFSHRYTSYQIAYRLILYLQLPDRDHSRLLASACRPPPPRWLRQAQMCPQEVQPPMCWRRLCLVASRLAPPPNSLPRPTARNCDAASHGDRASRKGPAQSINNLSIPVMEQANLTRAAT